MTEEMKSFIDVQAGIDLYQVYDYSDEFPTVDSTSAYVDDEDDETPAHRQRYEAKMLHEAVGGATADELKVAGLGYVDMDPDPSPKPSAARLRRYWTRGEGALKIKWGTSGDFRRCVRHLRKYVGPGAEGLCQVYHKSANGYYTGDKRNKSDMFADIETKNLVVESKRLRLENLFLSKRLFDGWERVEGKSGMSYDIGFNVLTDMWEAHEAKNFVNTLITSTDESSIYEILNRMEGGE